MGMNSTPSSERVHIGIFGKRNAGKSSVINALTNQDIAIVSNILGTTTDPVYKAMEILPIGPVMIIDTPGIDDEGELGALRVKRSLEVLKKIHIGILVVDAKIGLSKEDQSLIESFEAEKLEYIIVYNKSDLANENITAKSNEIYVSAVNGDNIDELRKMISKLKPDENNDKTLVGDIVKAGDFVVLVVPIDSSAPKGRLILPQQQTIRGILEAGATSIVVRDTELKSTLNEMGRKPNLVITDSQAFAKVSKETPSDIMLTSFSILFARYKGDLSTVVQGAKVVDSLNDGDDVLISEGCTHHRQCEDIGAVKLPKWIDERTGKKINYHFSTGTGFSDDLSKYKLIIHCGACILNEKDMQNRIQKAKDNCVPITNYGILIAYMNGILKRTLEPFPEIYTNLID